MKELRSILAEAARQREAGRPFALATVVKIDGSAYRQPGARMLVTGKGTTTGTISGGCLEGEVAQRALDVIEDGQPQVLPFDLSDDDLIMGYGMGCDGRVHVLIEPAFPGDGPAEGDPLAFLAESMSERVVGVLATIIGPSGSERLGRRLFVVGQRAVGDLARPALRDALQPDAEAVRRNGRQAVHTYRVEGEELEVFLELVRPPVQMVVLGTEHDARPVVRLARELGWLVTLVGRKPVGELTERFPLADRHVFLMHPEEVAQKVALDARTAAVVMNHNYARDKALVGALLASPVAYVGALGAAERNARIAEELRAERSDLADEQLGRLHGPMGLDIGSETPQEIALAAVAEAQAVLHGRVGGKLRAREGRIHDPITDRA